jgi:hypothetical protein
LQPDRGILLLGFFSDLTVARFLGDTDAQVQEIPTLDSFGLILLMSLLGGVAFLRLRG